MYYLLTVSVPYALIFSRHNNSKPEDVELPNVDDRPPAPLPRPSATLEATTPHDVHVTQVQTSSYHNEAVQGAWPQETMPSGPYENVTLMPLSEAGEIADQQLCANTNYAASEGTGSEAYIREVETVPPNRLQSRMSDTLPRDDLYMKPIANSSTSPLVTNHSSHSTPHHTPPTSPKMLATTSRGVSHRSTMSPPAADSYSPKCSQSTTPLAVYPSVSPGYVTHTPPTSPACTIATMACTEPTHFLFPPKCVGKNSDVFAKKSIHGNHCANCGLQLGSVSDSRIVRPGYILHGSALGHRSTGELHPYRSPAGDSKNGSCPGRDQPCLNSPNERYRHASMPLEDHTASKDKSLSMPCKYREQFSMHSLDLRTSRESCNTFPSTSARTRMQANGQGYVVQEVKTSGETTRCGPAKCKGMQHGYIVSGDSSRPKISDSSKAAVPHCPDGYLTHYPPSSGQVGRMEKDLQSHYKRNGYVRQTLPVCHHQTQAFTRESRVSKPTVFSCSRDASKSAATPQHSADSGLRSYSPSQVVQLPDDVVEDNGELFRTQLWLLGGEEDSDSPHES